MAVWQYDVHIVPRAKVLEIYGRVPPAIDLETFDAADWWRNTELPDIGSLGLAQGSSWDVELLAWGNEDSDRVEVLLENGAPRELFVRVDLRSQSGFLSRVIEMVARGDCLFLTPRLRLLEPTHDIVEGDVLGSDALRFVLDPEAYFRSLKKGTVK